jgi:Ner family transcriptional regulator
MSVHIDGVRNVEPAWLKAEIAMRFGSVAALAAKFSANPNTVQAAIIRPQPSGNHIIADALGYPVHELWPEWFLPGGLRIRRSAKTKGKRRTAISSSQKRALA